ncbi:MAG: response regulator transcription factor [Lachnospiraceae bacterium]|nr:response regulator transcription factor [Lachnospiraceae bacterium]
MKIAICDDEMRFHIEFKKYMDQYAKLRALDIIYYEYTNGKDLLASNKEYDVIFMDYQMNTLNGLDTARKLRQKNNQTTIIFLTSYPNIVFDVFEVNTFRFLMKPINMAKLTDAMDSYLKSQDTSNYIMLKIDDNTKKINQKDIIYIEASDKYCYIRTVDDNLLYKKTLAELAATLTLDTFYRCHRSYLVNFNHIVSHTNNDITFTNNEKALISKTKLTGFKNAFLAHIKSHNFS